MAIDVRCPHCGKELQARDQFAGQKMPCPECGGILLIQGKTNPYAAPDTSGPLPDAKTSGAAVASMVLGILSLVFLCSIFTGIPAIVLGLVAQSRIGKSGGRLKGSGKATAGIVTGSIGTILLPCLIALVLPGVQSAREAARRMQCSTQLRQIGLALHNYQNANGSFPPAYTTDDNGQPLLSWRVLILPYMDQEALYDQFELNEPWNSPANQTLLSRMPNVFRCPSELGTTEEGLTTYGAIVGPRTIFEPGHATTMAEITDGLTNTLLVAESSNKLEWTRPVDITYTPGQPLAIGGRHAGGSNVVFADGSARFLGKAEASMPLDPLAERDDGKQIPTPP